MDVPYDGVDSPFKYNHMGSLICLGSNNGMAQFPDSGKFNVWDAVGASNLGVLMPMINVA